jgi:hypothetical protein
LRPVGLAATGRGAGKRERELGAQELASPPTNAVGAE